MGGRLLREAGEDRHSSREQSRTNEERRPHETHAVEAWLSEGSGAASVTGMVVSIASAALGDVLVLKLPLGGKIKGSRSLRCVTARRRSR